MKKREAFQCAVDLVKGCWSKPEFGTVAAVIVDGNGRDYAAAVGARTEDGQRISAAERALALFKKTYGRGPSLRGAFAVVTVPPRRFGGEESHLNVFAKAGIVHVFHAGHPDPSLQILEFLSTDQKRNFNMAASHGANKTVARICDRAADLISSYPFGAVPKNDDTFCYVFKGEGDLPAIMEKYPVQKTARPGG